MKLDRALRHVLQLAQEQITARTKAGLIANTSPMFIGKRTYEAAVQLVTKYQRPAWIPEAVAARLLHDLERFKAQTGKREYTDTEVAWKLLDETMWVLKKSLNP